MYWLPTKHQTPTGARFIVASKKKKKKKAAQSSDTISKIFIFLNSVERSVELLECTQILSNYQ